MRQSQKFLFGGAAGLMGMLLFLMGNFYAADAEQTDLIPVLPDTLDNYANQPLPAHYTGGPVRAADNVPDTNPITDAGATLGRVLFYDRTLSANGTIACASCHLQEEGFSDSRQFSVGFDGGLTGRNSMGLANSRYYASGFFFWDERSASLEHQVLQPFQDDVEMGLTLEQLVTLVESQPYYAPLFQEAFGSTEVTSDRISLALAQFVRAMVSTDSKYDQVLRGTAVFTAQEAEGQEIFRISCGACHGTDAHIAPEARNNGLDVIFADNGLGEVTGDPTDDGKFKTPSLRNIELTAPYMHDGRFATLEEVIDFYSTGIQPHANLDPILQRPNGDPRQFRFDEQEEAALLAFLFTLTDTTLATDPKFSDPFVVDPATLTDQVYLPVIMR